MQKVRKSVLKLQFICIFLCLSAVLSAQATRDSRILSPCPGTWGNMQSLVVQADSGCDVYYSVTEINPLLLGIAYDGPVILDQTGNCSVAVSIVDPDGTTSTSIISYTVKTDSVPVPALRNNKSPVISLTEDDSFPVPSDTSWTVSSHSFNGNAEGNLVQQKGGRIAINGPTSSSYYAELLLKSEKSQFRYILNVAGTDAGVSDEISEPAVSDIEFSQWNWVRFYQGEAVLYRVDDDPWRQTTKPVYIDRSEPHTLYWKLVSPVTSRSGDAVPEDNHTLYLPAKPVLTGLPAKGFSQTNVALTTENQEYMLSYKGADGTVCYADTWYADVLTGDSRGFSQTFTLYYRGIKQGTISGSFIIDKSAPVKPVITTSSEGVFSRKPVLVQIYSDATVYVKVSSVETIPEGFSLETYYNVLPVIADLQNAEESLIAMFGSAPDSKDLQRCGYYSGYDDSLILESDPDGAVLYLVSAIARDAAGNISGLSFYHAVIDSRNFYISADSAVPADGTSIPAGFIDNPYRSLQETLAACDGIQNPRLYLIGMIPSSTDVLLNKNCVLQGISGGGIRFTRDNKISVFNATVSIDNLRIEKKLSEKVSSVTQSNLLLIQNASVRINQCDVLANLGDSGTAVMCTDSTVTLSDSLLSLQAKNYGCAVSCETTDFNVFDTQLFVTARTCSGVTQFRNACRLDTVSMQLTGSLVQAISLSDAYGDLSDCTFTDVNRSASSAAVWTGGDSAYSLSGCSAAGFKALIAD